MLEKIINLLIIVYQETFSQVRASDTLTQKFGITTGVRQGPVLSPLLFVMVIDWAMDKALADRKYGIELDDTIVSDLAFANDMSPRGQHRKGQGIACSSITQCF